VTSANPSIFKQSFKLPSPLAIAMTPRIQTRPAATTSVPGNEANSILAGQRRNRPISPHLSIYRPQITWIASSLNRITGLTLSGTFYLFGAAYLVAPLLGWHLESASIAAAFASWPVLAKMGVKAFFAWPFTFHSLNGIRHMLWDAGSQFSNKQVIMTGWTVVGLSVVSALGLTFLV
jgi:succinate dehydrogenase (ubiquinone) cytochrome b560 subunit